MTNALMQSSDEHVVRTRVLASLDKASASIPMQEREFECAVFVVYAGITGISMSTAFNLPSQFLVRLDRVDPLVHCGLPDMMNVLVGGPSLTVSIDPVDPNDDWADVVYGLVESGESDAAMDRVYEHVDVQLGANLPGVDSLLRKLDPQRLGAEVVVSVLIATLAAKDRLGNRADFIARSRSVLERESEGANEVLRGLE